MVRPSDGAILWKCTYEKTQQGLLENLLDFSTFMEGGGRWMKVEQLGMLGLKKMLATMPGKPKPVKREGEAEGDNL